MGKSKSKVARFLLQGVDVVLDSLTGIPGAGALKEIKDGSSAVLERARGIEDDKTTA
jgi:hypothetical protein